MRKLSPYWDVTLTTQPLRKLVYVVLPSYVTINWANGEILSHLSKNPIEILNLSWFWEECWCFMMVKFNLLYSIENLHSRKVPAKKSWHFGLQKSLTLLIVELVIINWVIYGFHIRYLSLKQNIIHKTYWNALWKIMASTYM